MAGVYAVIYRTASLHLALLADDAATTDIVVFNDEVNDAIRAAGSDDRILIAFLGYENVRMLIVGRDGDLVGRRKLSRRMVSRQTSGRDLVGSRRCLPPHVFVDRGARHTTGHADAGRAQRTFPHPAAAWNGSEFVAAWSADTMHATRFDGGLKLLDVPFEVTPSGIAAFEPSIAATGSGVEISYVRIDDVPRLFTRTLHRLGALPRVRPSTH